MWLLHIPSQCDTEALPKHFHAYSNDTNDKDKSDLQEG